MENTYEIIPPAIPSAGLYYFNTDSGTNYEVRFGRKQNDLLSATIVFGVLNEEYEGEEYIETNKGEVFRVMSTIVDIIKMFKKEHPNVRSYEFTGEPAYGEVESENHPTKRLRVYQRYIRRIFNPSEWDIKLSGNRIIVSKIMKRY